MRVNEIKQTKEVVVITEYIAGDGKIFYTREECEKYEKTCKCVIMADYKRLVKSRITEYDLYNECGSEEYYYDIIEINNEQDRDIVNKALLLENKNAKLIEGNGTYLIALDYDENISGYHTTIEEILNTIKKSYDKALRGDKNVEN